MSDEGLAAARERAVLVRRPPRRHQGRGLGVKVMDTVVAYLQRVTRPGPFVGLMDADNAEGFYERYGFQRRRDRTGMFRVW